MCKKLVVLIVMCISLHLEASSFTVVNTRSNKTSDAKKAVAPKWNELPLSIKFEPGCILSDDMEFVKASIKEVLDQEVSNIEGYKKVEVLLQQDGIALFTLSGINTEDELTFQEKLPKKEQPEENMKSNNMFYGVTVD